MPNQKQKLLKTYSLKFYYKRFVNNNNYIYSHLISI